MAQGCRETGASSNQMKSIAKLIFAAIVYFSVIAGYAYAAFSQTV